MEGHTEAVSLTGDPQLTGLLTGALRLSWASASVVGAPRLDDALSHLRSMRTDLVIVDADSNGGDVDSLVGAIRAASTVPIVVLSTRDEETDLVRAINNGADAFVTRPFDPAVLGARVAALLRRSMPELGRPDTEVRVGDIVIDQESRAVSVGGTPVKLTPTEYRLLHYLAKNVGRLASKESLSRLVWPGSRSLDASHLKVFISRLRGKIKTKYGPKFIETERGRGYRLVIPASPES